MAIDLVFRQRAVRTLSNAIGCYALCDLDQVPVYVGQSTDRIRARVSRHLTSARSDIIANRQIDVWKRLGLAYSVADRAEIAPLDSALFYEFNTKSALMNGRTRRQQAAGSRQQASLIAVPLPAQVVQVMSDVEIAEKRHPALRLPRLAEHHSQIVSHFLAVKPRHRLRTTRDRTPHQGLRSCMRALLHRRAARRI